MYFFSLWHLVNFFFLFLNEEHKELEEGGEKGDIRIYLFPGHNVGTSG